MSTFIDGPDDGSALDPDFPVPPVGPNVSESPVGDADTEEGLIFTSLDSFVAEYIGRILCRRLNRATAVWCPEWWRHAEAVMRLSAMWRAFEYLRVDAALGMSTFWLHHADPHMRVLMNPESGPFALCDPREGHAVRELEPLPMTPSPPEIWDDPAFRLDASDVGADTGGETGQPPPSPSGHPEGLEIGTGY